MSPTSYQMRIRSENGENATQNPHAKSRSGSTPMCNVASIGNQLEYKPDCTSRLCFENFNRLPTSKHGCNSDNVSSLRHVWSKLNVDFKSTIETQIDLLLLPNKDSLHAAMFQNHAAKSMLLNNANKLIGRSQQGGAMTIVKGRKTQPQ